ncbi:U3 small nucleolar ribonucleoprotein imp3 [Elasticomyces elasticus]|nr:U3 small nucleolar ribonucleoprotein imp3 [Elasticomyces elasticus]KAK5036820.1 U3 small nucleolar ribonucleoprotein imp3 [Exophiala sideris]
MVRKLKHHEQRLLRKVDLITYKSDGANHREAAVRRRYHLTQPLDYSKYNVLCGRLRQLTHHLSNLDPADPYRVEMETVMLEKLHQIGILKQNRGQGAGLSNVEKDVTVSAFCRRRLGVLMVRIGMVEHISTAHKFIEQGHIRVGTEVVTDPAFLISRGMEDFVTWVDGRKESREMALSPHQHELSNKNERPGQTPLRKRLSTGRTEEIHILDE